MDQISPTDWCRSMPRFMKGSCFGRKEPYKSRSWRDGPRHPSDFKVDLSGTHRQVELEVFSPTLAKRSSRSSKASTKAVCMPASYTVFKLVICFDWPPTPRCDFTFRHKWHVLSYDAISRIAMKSRTVRFNFRSNCHLFIIFIEFT
jgi:hypothetical protein